MSWDRSAPSCRPAIERFWIQEVAQEISPTKQRALPPPPPPHGRTVAKPHRRQLEDLVSWHENSDKPKTRSLELLPCESHEDTSQQHSATVKRASGVQSAQDLRPETQSGVPRLHAIRPAHIKHASHSLSKTTGLVSNKALRRVRRCFEVSADEGYLQNRWSERPECLQKRLPRPASLDLEMGAIQANAARKAMGGHALRVNSKGVRQGSAVRTLHLLHLLKHDPMTSMNVNAKVVDEWVKPPKASYGPGYHTRPGARDEFRHKLEVDFNLDEASRLRDQRKAKECTLRMGFEPENIPRPGFAAALPRRSSPLSPLRSSNHSRGAAPPRPVLPPPPPDTSKRPSLESWKWDTSTPSYFPLDLASHREVAGHR